MGLYEGIHSTKELSKMSIEKPTTEAGRFVTVMKQYNPNGKPTLEKENLFMFGSIALVTTNNISMVLIYNRFNDQLFPMLTVSRDLDSIALTLFNELSMNKGYEYSEGL